MKETIALICVVLLLFIVSFLVLWGIGWLLWRYFLEEKTIVYIDRHMDKLLTIRHLANAKLSLMLVEERVQNKDIRIKGYEKFIKDLANIARDNYFISMLKIIFIYRCNIRNALYDLNTKLLKFYKKGGD